MIKYPASLLTLYIDQLSNYMYIIIYAGSSLKLSLVSKASEFESDCYKLVMYISVRSVSLVFARIVALGLIVNKMVIATLMEIHKSAVALRLK